MVINYNMLKNIYKGKTILVTGGTGTLGSLLVEQILRKDNPKKIIIYSRDEIKQEQMELDYQVLNQVSKDILLEILEILIVLILQQKIMWIL